MTLSMYRAQLSSIADMSDGGGVEVEPSRLCFVKGESGVRNGGPVKSLNFLPLRTGTTFSAAAFQRAAMETLSTLRVKSWDCNTSTLR